MAWEYLLTRELDARVLPVAGYLANKINGNCIVELDCGHAPILKYLPKTYKSYYGNDILGERLPEYLGARFYQMKDDEFVKGDFDVDILLVFGLGGYEISKEALESSTLTQSIFDLVDREHPGVVVIESIQKYSPVQDSIEVYLKDKGYSIVHKIKVETRDNWLHKRLITIYEANNSNPNK